MMNLLTESPCRAIRQGGQHMETPPPWGGGDARPCRSAPASVTAASRVLALLLAAGWVTPALAEPSPAPANLNLTRADASGVVTWTAPAVAAITGYELEKAAGPEYARWDKAVVAGAPECAGGPPATCTVTVTGLTNGTDYKLRVRGVVGKEPGAWAESPRWFTPVAPADLPGVPGGLSGVPGNGAITASWTAPNEHGAGAAAITRYRVFALDGSQLAGVCQTTGTPAPTTCTVTGLTNGTAYTLKVRSFNNLSKYSDISGPAGPYTPGP